MTPRNAAIPIINNPAKVPVTAGTTTKFDAGVVATIWARTTTKITKLKYMTSVKIVLLIYEASENSSINILPPILIL